MAHNTIYDEILSLGDDLQFLPACFFTAEELANSQSSDPSGSGSSRCPSTGASSPPLSASATAATDEAFVPGAYDNRQAPQLAHFGVKDSASSSAELSRWELNSPFLGGVQFECQQIEPENRERFKDPRRLITPSARGKWVLPPPGMGQDRTHMRFVNEEGLVWHSAGFLLEKCPAWISILLNPKYK